MANTVFMSKTGLIGGEATKLDSIDGAGLVDGDAAFVNVSNVQYIYRLDADSAAVESSPDIIAPDANAGDKRWILQGVYAASLSFTGLTASLPVFTDGTKKLVSNTMTGTGSVVMSNSPTLVTPTLGAATATSLTAGSSRPVTVSNGALSIKADSGAWSLAYGFSGSGGTDRGGFGALGSADTVTNFFIGPSYASPYMTLTSGVVNIPGLTASLPVFTDGSKNLVSKSVADTLAALGLAMWMDSVSQEIEDLQNRVEELEGRL